MTAAPVLGQPMPLPLPLDYVQGDETSVLLPAHGAALLANGVALLTTLFRAFGSLSLTNSVSNITRCETCQGGSTGQKLFLSVEYLIPEPHLDNDLFVKFSRDFSDPARDERGKYEMESEVRFAAISRLQSFPISVPRTYFADYHDDSKTGLLITQRILFGMEGIEPHRAKCLDHEIEEPVRYYRTLIRTLGRMAGTHQSARLSADVAARFPYDAQVAMGENPIVYSEPQMHVLVDQYAAFAKSCPQLLSPNITTSEFIQYLDREVCRYLRYETVIKRFLQSSQSLIALCHWNAQIDNAWFWTDSDGMLQCGLIDWGHVNQMNVAFSIWGCLSGAPQHVWDSHLDELIALFAQEFHRYGGARIAESELKLHLQLYIAMMGLSFFMASPARILARLPESVTASGPLDPVFRGNEPARSNLQILALFLNLFRSHDFGQILDDLLLRLAGDGSMKTQKNLG